ncbi:MAG: response regulator transcription factor [Chloroflexi bacterium]|nr:response regulator transcription factor [Chloroflexota bacterium]
MIRLLVAHEVRLTADLMASVLGSESDIEIVACAYTTTAALTLLKEVKCDVLLVSVTLPQNGAARLTRAATNMPNSIKVLITGLVEAKALIIYWLEAGVAGYVHANESLATLIEKVRRATRGECMISPSLAAALITRIDQLKQQIVETRGIQALNPNTLYAELSERECEVLGLIEQRYTNRGIGDTLCIELGTVKNHVHNILDKLGVRTRQQAAMIARQAVVNVAIPLKM